MKKIFKKALIVGGVALAAHFGLKAYKRISGLGKLSKSLPEFLNNVYGEKPAMNINQTLNMLNIGIGFKQEILDKHADIETTVREYIDDFYPEMGKCAITIDIYAKTEEEGEEAVEEEEPEA